jgi:hypothetical protein
LPKINNDESLGKWLVAVFKKDIFKIRHATPVDKKPWLMSLFSNDIFRIWGAPQPVEDTRPHLKVNLAGLNRMQMRKLQYKLVEKVLEMRYTGKEPEGWEDLLERYSKSPIF